MEYLSLPFYSTQLFIVNQREFSIKKKMFVLNKHKIDLLSSIVDMTSQWFKRKTYSISYKIHKTVCGVCQPLQSHTFSLMVARLYIFFVRTQKKKLFLPQLVSLSTTIVYVRMYTNRIFFYNIHQRSMNIYTV